MIGPAGFMAAPKASGCDEAREVQCTRCRNKHQESDRIQSRPDRYGMRALTCPRCGGKTFHRVGSRAGVSETRPTPAAQESGDAMADKAN